MSTQKPFSLVRSPFPCQLYLTRHTHDDITSSQPLRFTDARLIHPSSVLNLVGKPHVLSETSIYQVMRGKWRTGLYNKLTHTTHNISMCILPFGFCTLQHPLMDLKLLLNKTGIFKIENIDIYKYRYIYIYTFPFLRFCCTCPKRWRRLK